MEFINITPEAESFLKQWYNSADYIIAHTSGSTGAPKEIKLLKSDMLVSARATNLFFDITAGDTLLCPLSADYIAGKMMIVRAIAADARLILEKPSNSPLKEDYGSVKLMPVVPSQIPAIPVERLASVENLLIGGAPLSPIQENYVRSLGVKAYASYGMTETASHVALRKIGSEDYYDALPGISFKCDSDSCLNIVAPAFSFGSLQTNDVVELLSETRFHWLGRRDNVVISGGIKLHPELIEKKLTGIIDNNFFTVGVSDDKWGEKLVLCVENGLSCSVDELKILLSQHLDPYEIPKEIRILDSFEYTSSGKIIRRPSRARSILLLK